MEMVTEDLALMRFPLSLGGAQIGRNVTLIRLSSGDVLIHSTGPFTSADLQQIQAFGRPAALVEATRFHDTFALAGARSFPDVPYFVPPDFPVAGIRTQSLADWPSDWQREVEVLELSGMPKAREHVFYHPSSRTLIAADLFFNFGPSATSWTRFVFRSFAGIRSYPGISRFFRFCIQDKNAFQRSMARLFEWDFDRVIVGHGEIIQDRAKQKCAAALEACELFHQPELRGAGP